MKITVLTILILIFMAGLALVQMDANTENQIQVLSEKEMFRTQGAATTDICEKDKFVEDGHPKRLDFCKTKDCQLEWTGFGWKSYKQFGHLYNWCLDNFNRNWNCKTAEWGNINEGTQSCGHRQEYIGPNCISFLAIPQLRDLIIPQVERIPRDPTIPCSSS